MPSRVSTGIALMFFSAVGYGTVFPIAKTTLLTIDGFYFSSIRYGLVCVVMSIILLLTEGSKAFDAEGHLKELVGFSSGFAGFNLIMFVGLAYAKAEHAAIIMATQPLIACIVSWVVKGVRPNRMTLGCVLAAFSGVFLVITKGSLNVLHDRAMFADLVIIVGAFAWVIYTFGSGYFSGWSTLRYTTLSCFFGSLMIIAVTIIATLTSWSVFPGANALWSIKWPMAYLIGIGAFAVLTWNAGNKIIGAVNGVLFTNLIPVTTITMQYMKGKRLSAIELGGAALTIAALIVNNLNVRRVQMAGTAPPSFTSIPGARAPQTGG